MNLKKIFLFVAYIICGQILSAHTSVVTQTLSIDLTVQVTTTVSASPAKITFNWPSLAGAKNIKIYRKSINDQAWGLPTATLSASATQYTDANVTLGTDYEYLIEKNPTSGNAYASTYIYTGIQVPAIEYRGKMILIVDNTMATPLLTELKQLERNLIGDGWQVKRIDVSRTASVTSIKSSIINEYNADPQNVKAVFLFGHVPVPYSGNINPDGHPDHRGAWPADIYYGDMNETYWIDTQINNSSASGTRNDNVPGDGKFDEDVPPVPGNKAELAVGRVDLSNMPEFSLSETELLRQYLNRDHNYKYKIINPQRRALMDDNFGYFGGEAFASSGWRDFSAMLGASKIYNLDYLSTLKTQDYLWSYGCGAGTFTFAGGIGSTHQVDSISPKTVFTMLYGSYFGDWDSNDNFLRAPLAASGWTLASMWSGRPWWHVHHMGLGLNIGYSTLISQNNYNVSSGGIYSVNPYDWSNSIHIALMGDPSLRMHVVAPPSNINNTYTTGALTINLTWNASSEAVAGYHVYRLDPVTKKYNRVNTSIITGLNYTDNSPNTGTNYYMVRASKLEAVSGSYYNLSQGIFDTVQTTLSIDSNIADNQVKLNVYPTPISSGFANIELDLNKEAEVKIILIDMYGKEVQLLTQGNYPEGNHLISFNCNNLKAGVYNCVAYINNKLCNKLLVISE